MAEATITIRDYDVPAGFSHLGVVFNSPSGGSREFNFGSYRGRDYQSMGKPWDMGDTLGGVPRPRGASLACWLQHNEKRGFRRRRSSANRGLHQ